MLIPCLIWIRSRGHAVPNSHLVCHARSQLFFICYFMCSVLNVPVWLSLSVTTLRNWMELKWEFMVLLGLLKYFAGLETHYISWWPYLTSATISVTKGIEWSFEPPADVGRACRYAAFIWKGIKCFKNPAGRFGGQRSVLRQHLSISECFANIGLQKILKWV